MATPKFEDTFPIDATAEPPKFEDTFPPESELEVKEAVPAIRPKQAVSLDRDIAPVEQEDVSPQMLTEAEKETMKPEASIWSFPDFSAEGRRKNAKLMRERIRINKKIKALGGKEKAYGLDVAPKKQDSQYIKLRKMDTWAVDNPLDPRSPEIRKHVRSVLGKPKVSKGQQKYLDWLKPRSNELYLQARGLGLVADTGDYEMGEVPLEDRTWGGDISERYWRNSQDLVASLYRNPATAWLMSDEDKAGIKRFRQYRKEEEYKKPTSGHGFIADMLTETVGMLPYMGGGAATAVINPLAPLAFFATAGSGEIYQELEDMGIDDSVAIPLSLVAGIGYGVVENMQAARAFPGMKKLGMTGLGRLAKKFTRNTAMKRVKSELKRRAFRAALEVGRKKGGRAIIGTGRAIGNVLMESGQEAIQEGIKVGAEHIGAGLNNLMYDTEILKDASFGGDLISRSSDAFVQSIGPMSFITGFGHGSYKLSKYLQKKVTGKKAQSRQDKFYRAMDNINSFESAYGKEQADKLMDMVADNQVSLAKVIAFSPEKLNRFIAHKEAVATGQPIDMITGEAVAQAPMIDITDELDISEVQPAITPETPVSELSPELAREFAGETPIDITDEVVSEEEAPSGIEAKELTVEQAEGMTDEEIEDWYDQRDEAEAETDETVPVSEFENISDLEPVEQMRMSELDKEFDRLEQVIRDNPEHELEAEWNERSDALADEIEGRLELEEDVERAPELEEVAPEQVIEEELSPAVEPEIENAPKVDIEEELPPAVEPEIEPEKDKLVTTVLDIDTTGMSEVKILKKTIKAIEDEMKTLDGSDKEFKRRELMMRKGDLREAVIKSRDEDVEQDPVDVKIQEVAERINTPIERADVGDDKTANALKGISKTLNAPINFVKMGKGGIHGFAYKGEVFVNIDSDVPILKTAAHEVTHVLQERYPELWEKFKGSLETLYSKENYKQWADERSAQVEQRIGEKPGDDALLQELAADVIRDQAGNESFWKNLNGIDATLVEKILAILKEIKSSVSKVISKSKSTEMQKVFGKQLDQAIKAGEDFISKAAGEEKVAEKKPSVKVEKKVAKKAEPMSRDEWIEAHKQRFTVDKKTKAIGGVRDVVTGETYPIHPLDQKGGKLTRVRKAILGDIYDRHVKPEVKLSIGDNFISKIEKEVTKPVVEAIHKEQIKVDGKWYAKKIFKKKDFKIGDSVKELSREIYTKTETPDFKISSGLFRESGANVSHVPAKIAKYKRAMKKYGGWGDFPPITGREDTITKDDVNDYKKYGNEKGYSRAITTKDIGKKIVHIENGHNRAYAAKALGIDIPVFDLEKQETTQPDIMLSVGKDVDPDSKSLVVVHNLSEKNLKFADELGGLAAPSMAVVDVEKSAFTGFGEITLVAGKDMVDPKAWGSGKTYDADVYSPRYPSVRHTVNKKVFNKIAELIEKYTIGAWYDSLSNDNIERDGIAPLYRNYGLKRAYLAEQGINIKDTYKKKEVSEFLKARPGLKKLKNKFYSSLELRKDKAFYQRVKEYYKTRVHLQKDIDDDAAFNLALQYAEEIFRTGEPRKLDSEKMAKSIDRRLKEKDFENWVDDKFSDVIKDKKFFKGFTPSGTRRYADYTLANVLKELKGNIRGGESFFYGPGSIRSSVAKKFKSLVAIKKEKGRIVSAQEMEDVKGDMSNELEDVAALYESNYKHGGYSFEAFGKALAEGAKTNRIEQELKETGFDGIENYQPIYDYLNKLKNAPTEYFESKFQRNVYLNEFKGAVAPRKTNPKVIAMLEKQGIKVLKYNENIKDDRKNKIKDISSKVPDIMFSLTDERKQDFKEWRYERYSYLEVIEEDYGGKVKPTSGNKEDITGSWIDFKNGASADVVAEHLGIDEDVLIEKLNGLQKRDLRKRFSDEFKLRSESDRIDALVVDLEDQWDKQQEADKSAPVWLKRAHEVKQNLDELSLDINTTPSLPVLRNKIEKYAGLILTEKQTVSKMKEIDEQLKTDDKAGLIKELQNLHYRYIRLKALGKYEGLVEETQKLKKKIIDQKTSSKRQILLSKYIKKMLPKMERSSFLRKAIALTKYKKPATVDKHLAKIIKDVEEKAKDIHKVFLIDKARLTFQKEAKRLKSAEKRGRKSDIAYEQNKVIEGIINHHYWGAAANYDPESGKRNVYDMSKNELINVLLTLESIKQTGRSLKAYQEYENKKEIAYQAELGKAEVLEHAPKDYDEYLANLEKAKQRGHLTKGMKAALNSPLDFLKKTNLAVEIPESMIESLSGYDTESSTYKNIWTPLYDGVIAGKENLEKAVNDFKEIVKPLELEKNGKKIMTNIFLKLNIKNPGKEKGKYVRNLSIDEIMGMYAHSKNVFNRRHLLATIRSYAPVSHRQAVDTLNYALEKLPQKYKDVVNRQIDYYDNVIYDRINAVFRRMHGVDMDKELSYFPIMDLYRKGENLLEFLSGEYGLSAKNTKKGFMAQRQGTSNPFKSLSYMETVLTHMQDVEQMIALSEPVWRVREFLNSDAIQKSIEHKNKFIHKQLNRWVDDVAYGKFRMPERAAGRIARKLRLNMAAAVLGFNLKTPPKQTISIIQGASMGKNVEIARAMKIFASHPIDTWKFIANKDVVMRERASRFNLTVSQLKESKQFKEMVHAENISNKVQELSFWGIRTMDKFGAGVVWLAKYNEIKSTGGSEKSAIKEARRAVRLTQPAGDIINIPDAYRRSEIFTWFATFTNQLNKNYSMLKRAIKTKNYKILFGLVLSSVALQFVNSGFNPFKTADEPDELARTVLNTATGGHPIMGRIVDMGARAMISYGRRAAGYKVPPWYTGVKDAFVPSLAKGPVDLGESLVRSISKGKLDSRTLDRSIRGLMLTFGIPGYYPGSYTIKNFEEFRETGDPRYLAMSKYSIKPSFAKKKKKWRDMTSEEKRAYRREQARKKK